ncbi:hypothetical protein, partial [Lunatimonas lonarensis]|uniref:hypothetical protein n=1 Tax=Lunatimonas lonarensis TaxID=1232681 RepID=UPI001EE37BE0
MKKNKKTYRRYERTPGGNSVYVAIAGEVVNRRSVHLRNFILSGQVNASNPLLHIHAKRYRQSRILETHLLSELTV